MAFVYVDIFLSLIFVLPIVYVIAAAINNGGLIFQSIGVFSGILIASRSAKTMRSITVSGTAISGQKFLSFKRTSFKIESINKINSNKRNILLKFLGTQYICSNDGEKIQFYRRVFSKSDIIEILSRCNLNTGT